MVSELRLGVEHLESGVNTQPHIALLASKFILVCLCGTHTTLYPVAFFFLRLVISMFHFERAGGRGWSSLGVF
jgi:hypothetical protein